MSRISSRCWLCFAASIYLTAAAPADADQLAHRFLEGLRSRGYFDVALDYLAQLESDPLIPRELKEVLDLEKATTLLNSARVERDSKLQRQQLDEAEQLLRRFIQQYRGHVHANAARSQLGNLVADRARWHQRESRKGNRQQHLEQARTLYGDARKIFAKHQELVRQELAPIPKGLDRNDPQQAALADRRTQLRAELLQTLLTSTTILEESAETIDPKSPEFDATLTEAAKLYGAMYKKYRTRLAGLYARLYQGRAHQRMGKLREALGFYIELLDQPDSPDPFRVLKTKTLRLAVDCWLDESQRKYAEAIARCAPWLSDVRSQEETQADWQYLRLSLARAYIAYAKANPQNSRGVLTSRNEAEKHLKAIVRHDGAYQAAAELLLADLSGSGVVNREEEPRTFEQARKAAKRALDLVEALRTQVQQRQQRLQTEEASKHKAEWTQEFEQASEKLRLAQSDALETFRLAVSLADEETSDEAVNLIRYFQAYVHHIRGDYYEAALIGDFVASRYPDSSSARHCAKIGMASFVQLYRAPDHSDKQFEAARIMAIAEHISNEWPEEPEAEEAIATLIPFTINAQQMDRALGYLDQLPEDSPHRSRSALIAGRALWQDYLAGIQRRRQVQQARPDQDTGPLPNELAEMKSKAHELLAEGVARLPANPNLDKSAATAILCFAQACLETERTKQAITVLEDAQHGPLTLVRARHPSTEVSGYIEDTYKTTLRAYLSSLSTAPQGDEIIRKTEGLMRELTSLLGDTPQGQRRIVRVYVGVARELEEHLREATPQSKEALSKGFETFLSQLSADATELSVLNWVAETFAGLGAGFDESGKLNQTAARYYEKSVEAFDNILNRVDLEPPTRIQIQVRLAGVRRRQRSFRSAMDLLVSVLREKNMTLNVQVEAARTLQSWASSEDGERRMSLYERAIQGDVADPATKRNVVWGWGKIGKVTANRAQFRDSFHNARLNLSRCRLQMAETKQGETRNRLLEMAVNDILLTKRLYGLGDERWTAQYDALLREIQKAQGEQPIGLRALEPKVG